MNEKDTVRHGGGGGEVHVPQELLSFIPGYLDRRQSDVKELRVALNKGDYESIHRIGHKLKGNGAGFGFDYISDLGMALQEAVDRRRFGDLTQIVDSYETEITRLRQKFAVS